MKRMSILTMVVALVGISQAWTVLENFESYDNSSSTLTSYATDGIWHSEFDDGEGNITANSNIIDFGDEHGQVLETIGGAAWRGAERNLTGTDAAVAVGEVKTYFWQVRVSSTSTASGWDYDFMMGLSPSVDNIDTTDAWQDFAVMPFVNNEATTPYINAASDTSPWWLLMTPGTWGNVWVVVNNDATDPSYDLYYSEGTGTPVQVADDAYWRGSETGIGPGTDLNAIGFMAAGLADCWYYIDNICYTSGEDLSVPSSFYSNIMYVSPVNGAEFIPVARDASENDLVFTVLDPNIVKADVYLSPGDPNVPDMIADDLTIGADGHDEVTITVTLETELTLDLLFETDYYWKVIGYEPNYVNGTYIPVYAGVWTFKTVPEAPLITSDPTPYTAVDAGEPSIVLTANGINGTLKWYKDGNPIDDTAGVYAGTTTGTLTIYDVQLADEGYYTMKITSGPLVAESSPARVMIHRQTSYYDFESISVVDGSDVFEDSLDGYHAVLMSEGSDAGWPTSVSDANSLPGLGAYLYLNNEDSETDPNGQYLQIYPGVVDYADITISFWVQSTNVDLWQRVFDFGNGTPDYLFITPDLGDGYDPRFAMRIDNESEQQLQADLNSSNWIGPGTGWHFVAVTIGGDTGRMFVDGEWYVTNESITVDPIDVGAVVNYIGKSQYEVDPEFSGYIDDLKIYNYARTNEQIAQDYMAVTGDSYICDTENNDVWRYDQGWEDDGVWIGGNNNCKLDLPDFAGMAVRWLEADQFYPAP